MRFSSQDRFYLGTLVSSVGSFTFNVCLVAFMVRARFDLFHVSLILGLQRLIPVVVTGALGYMSEAPGYSLDRKGHRDTLCPGKTS